MTTNRRRIVAVLIACMPVLALAQGYKCRQADGSISYQDHACAAGSASSSALPADLGGAAALRNDLAPGAGLDAGCQQSARHALSVCFAGMDAPLKRCQAARLTPECNAQMSTPGVRPDPSCARPAMACLGESLQNTKACMDRELPAVCRQQIDAYRNRRR